jgi:8-oxo-dGTP diphosphatase
VATGPISTGAAAVIFDASGRVLLVKENYGRRRWSLPGGAVEHGESLEEAAVRETWEETGVIAQVEHLIGSYGLDNGFTASAFRCVVVEGLPTLPSTGEIADLRWCPATDLPEPRSNILHYALPDALAGRRDVVRLDLPRVS